MTSSPHGPYGLGYTRTTMAMTEGSQPATVSGSQKVASVRIVLCGIASNRGSAGRGEYVPGPCTHRPSHHGSWFYLKTLC